MSSAVRLRASILLAGFSATALEDLRGLLGPGGDLHQVNGAAEALELVAAAESRLVLCVGGAIRGEHAEALVRRATEIRPDTTVNVVLTAGPEPEVFAELVAEDRIFYLCPKPPPPSDVAKILSGALREANRPLQHESKDAVGVSLTRRMLILVQQLAGEQSPERVAVLTARAAEQLTGAERGECLLYDAATETLWGPAPASGAEDRRESAAAGAVSFVLRTASPLRLDRVGEDSRYDVEIDNPGGGPRDRLLAVPVGAQGGVQRDVKGDVQGDVQGRGVLAVLKVLREEQSPPFGDREQKILAELAEHTAPVIGRLALQAELEASVARRRTDGGEPLFRREALAHHARGFQADGHLLQISPAWMPWAYRILLLVVAAAAIFGFFGSVHEYAAGPAVVRVEGRTDVTATLAGTVTSIDVRPGEPVQPGQLLVRLYGAQEAAELERIEREFELALLQRLRDPADMSTEGTLSALRAERQLAQARLDERSVRAPHAGIVGDVRCRPGEHLLPGQVLLSLADEEPDMAIIALLPGHYRPELEVGMPLRFELRGYRYAYQHLVVNRVGEEVLGPAEARRALGSAVGDAVPVSGSVVLVHAGLPARTFESGGRDYEMHDGSLGTVELRVRSERILEALVPGLAWLFEDDG